MGFHGAFLHANLGHLSLSGCLNPSEVVKLKEENLMYSAMREKEVKEQKALQLQVPDFAGEQMFFYHNIAHPIGSMYGIFAYIGVIYGVNVGKYSVEHLGIDMFVVALKQKHS